MQTVLFVTSSENMLTLTVALPGLEGFTTEELDTLDVRVRKELWEQGAEFHSFAVRGRVPAGGLKLKA